MTNFIRFFFCWLYLVAAPQLAAASASYTSERATVTLESQATTVSANTPFLLRLHFRLEDGWHIYWKNPGDSGLPPTLEWQLPEGFQSGEIRWPAPGRILIEGLMNYGYHEEVDLLIPITPPATLETGESYKLNLKANWLICKETCIPESGEFLVSVEGAETPEASSANEAVLAAEKNLPTPYVTRGNLQAAEQTLTLSLPWPQEISAEAYFYPDVQGVIDHAATQEWKWEEGILTATLKRGTEKPGEALEGVLQIGGDFYQIGFGKPIESGIKNQESGKEPSQPLPLATRHSSTTSHHSILSALFFAFLGGLLLNAMPCVFPVLSLKALAISKKAEADAAAVRWQGIAYLLGCMATFMLLAVILILLKQAGHAAGWGFQLQTPAFVTAMLCLFLLLGLGLSGLFEFPQLVGSFGQEKAAKDSPSGSFLTGVLAVLVATPCTVPFMAPALSYAFTQSTPLTLLVMAVMGLGMAVPYLLISFLPAARKLLPKPGAWMERFKQLMAFPMFATAAWLLWVLVQQVSVVSLARILALMIFLPFLLWLMHGKSRNVSLILTLLMLGAIAATITELQPQQQMAASLPQQHIAYDAKELERLRTAGTPVFLDATAAWCITCKVNENGVLQSEAIRDAFQKNGVITMVADWTNYDPAITALLESFDHQGVPLYVYYPPAQAEPKLLPQLLTEQIVLDALR